MFWFLVSELSTQWSEKHGRWLSLWLGESMAEAVHIVDQNAEHLPPHHTSRDADDAGPGTGYSAIVLPRH